MISLSRRRLLSGIVAGAASPFLAGCAHFVKPVTAMCPNDPSISDAAKPLTIDIHTHLFNGSDLQVKDFFVRSLYRGKPLSNAIGSLLDHLALDYAPTARQEMQRLSLIAPQLKNCNAGTFRQLVAQDAQTQYSIGVDKLKQASAKAKAGIRGFAEDPYANAIDSAIKDLPEHYKDYQSEQFHANLKASGITADGAIAFILQNFQYRYTNLFSYLDEYSRFSARKIDLVVTHLVDFDWPIGDGNPTVSSFADQVDVMEQIVALSGGRVHYFVPFDPFKEVAHGIGLTTESPLALVKTAIETKGAIGVKLYPPMGFAPFGNGELEAGKIWLGSYLPDKLQRPDIGLRLDEALSSLYSWCRQNSVPIMAHTAPSNLADPRFEQLLEPSYWEQVRASFPGLRVNFGHFGATSPTELKHPKKRALKLAHLMTPTPGSAGEFFYADCSFFADAVSQPAKLQATLADLMKETAPAGSAALAQRLMYGTDWEMILIEGQLTKNYLKNFIAIFEQLSKDNSLGAIGSLSDNFFGLNAARFLGVDKPDAPARRRIVDFYARASIPTPYWLAKL